MRFTKRRGHVSSKCTSSHDPSDEPGARQGVIGLLPVALLGTDRVAFEEAAPCTPPRPGALVEHHDRWSGPTVPAVLGDDGPEPPVFVVLRPGPAPAPGLVHEDPVAAFRWVRICSTIGLRWKLGAPDPVAQVAQSSAIPCPCRSRPPDGFFYNGSGLPNLETMIWAISASVGQPTGTTRSGACAWTTAPAAAQAYRGRRVTQHPELSRDDVELSETVLADLRHLPAAARAQDLWGSITRSSWAGASAGGHDRFGVTIRVVPSRPFRPRPLSCSRPSSTPWSELNVSRRKSWKLFPDRAPPCLCPPELLPSQLGDGCSPDAAASSSPPQPPARSVEPGYGTRRSLRYSRHRSWPRSGNRLRASFVSSFREIQ